ncbi:MAG: SDR family oxidoreductase [Pseudomonadota bacterium]
MSDPTQATQRTALVTGGSSGIGAAAASRLAGAGCHVAVTYRRNEQGAEETVRRCLDAGVDAFCVGGDVADDASCRAVAQAVLDRWGRIDVLVNNAGMTRFAEAGNLDALQAADFDRIFAVNVTGAYQMTRAAGAALEANLGSVVTVSSHAGLSGIGSSMAYAASKGALNTLTLSLARTLAPAVRVNAVCPGFVDTDWMKPKLGEDGLAAFRDRVAQNAPLKTVPTADDVADAIAWLALSARAITGQLLVIDGGTHLTVGSPL